MFKRASQLGRKNNTRKNVIKKKATKKNQGHILQQLEEITLVFF